MAVPSGVFTFLDIATSVERSPTTVEICEDAICASLAALPIDVRHRAHPRIA